MENENNGKQYVISVKGSADDECKAGITCSGYLIVAFGVPAEEAFKDEALVVIEHTSTKAISNAIGSQAELMQAACLAVGEKMARLFGRECELQKHMNDLKGFIEGLRK